MSILFSIERFRRRSFESKGKYMFRDIESCNGSLILYLMVNKELSEISAPLLRKRSGSLLNLLIIGYEIYWFSFN